MNHETCVAPAPLCDFSEFNEISETPDASYAPSPEVASQFYSDVSDGDLDELRSERDTLREKREDLLRGREHAKLALDILHLRQEIDQLSIGDISLHKPNSGYATPYATYRPPAEPKRNNVVSVEDTSGGDDVEEAAASPVTVFGFRIEQSTKQSKSSTCCSSPLAFTIGHLTVFLIFVATVALHVLAWFRPSAFNEVYKAWREDIWNSYDLNYLPSQWIFLITVSVYGLQLIWFIYGFTIPCRDKISGNFISSSLAGAGYFFLVLSYFSTIAWLFIWDIFDEDRYTAICVAGAAVFGLLSLGLFARQIDFYELELSVHASCDKVLLRILLLNSIGAQSFWCLMLLRYQIVILVAKYTNVDSEYHLYVYLAMKLLVLLIWFPVDIFCAKRKFSYVFLPYVVAITSSVPLLLQEELGNLAFMLTVFLVSTYGLLFIIKIGVTIGRERSSRPRSDVNADAEEKDLDTFHYGSQPETLDRY